MNWNLCVFPLILFFLNITSHSSSNSLCHPHERSALINFKNSFPAKDVFGDDNIIASWGNKDCCKWIGVTCDEVSGHVADLDLSLGGLDGVIDSNNSLFSLVHLRSLNLSGNYLGSSISPYFGRFSSLLHLDLSLCLFVGHVPSELAYLSNLLTLDLSSNLDLIAETSSLKRVLANLTSLVDLRLKNLNMFDVLPNYSFMNMSKFLVNMELGHNNLKGRFPENIFRLPNLEVLSLSSNPSLKGSFPQKNWVTQLKILDLSETGLSIDIAYLVDSLPKLNHLSAGNCSNIKLPFHSPAFSNITYLNLRDNNLGGEFPWTSLNFSSLTSLDLSNNKFKGQLPQTCKNSSSLSSIENNFLCDSTNHQPLGPLPLSLEFMDLGGNFLNGKIPAWLYSLPRLEVLSLGDNHFKGRIGEFENTSILRELSLGSNNLDGHIPRSLFQLESLRVLDLSSNNISGDVTLEQFLELRDLEIVDLSHNSLSGLSTPSYEYSQSHALWSLSLSSCNISEFPNILNCLGQLKVLDLSINKIQGNIPTWLWNVGNGSLYYLNISYNSLTHMSPIPLLDNKFVCIDLRSNQLQGHLPSLSTITFFASNNQFSGGISSLVCNQDLLEVLDLSNNNLSGNILTCAGNFNNSLSVLDLRMNKFDGIIPSAFAKGSSLRTLNLNGNRLEGSLPQSLLNAKSLEVLDVGNNRLNGTFPQFIESLAELRVLVLRSNRLHSQIKNPVTKFPFQNLRIMDLSDNKFTGTLPSKYFENFKAMIGAHTNKLKYLDNKGPYYRDSVMVSMKGSYTELVRIQTMFITIDFSRNGFTGEIPIVIGELNSLKGLNFSRNKLTGHIPPSLGNLSNLEWLDLSSNKLIGNIPQKLASNLNQLSFLNLSDNKLEGRIPRGTQFNTFNKDSYERNSGLYGFPLTESIHKAPGNSQDIEDQNGNGKLTWKLFALIGYGSGVGIGVSIGYAVFFSRKFDRWLRKRIPTRRHCKSL